MVHLDIKRNNIFVRNGLYKLRDLGLVGLASSMDVEEGDSRYVSRDMLQEERERSDKSKYMIISHLCPGQLICDHFHLSFSSLHLKV